MCSCACKSKVCLATDRRVESGQSIDGQLRTGRSVLRTEGGYD